MSTTNLPQTPTGGNLVFTDGEAGTLKRLFVFVNKRLVCEPTIPVDQMNGPFERAPTTGLGDLDRLPLELKIQVLLNMDMYAICRLREVNIASRDFVHSVYEYNIVCQTEERLVDALRTTKLGKRITLSQFWDLVRTKRCQRCQQPGRWLAVKFWMRLCRGCVSVLYPSITPNQRILPGVIPLDVNQHSFEGMFFSC
ncbi:hypothetical protein N7452_001369 [Penicillium brevicompactum]|uniref:F-box domain-containing protein n=1 Tax=Penicillium brevicompactum TaxID=5074 RepID=A0A9W9R3S9_PENBR|nr:hypothetical protein N7452_001369 [Penicillium brevicompactum]